MLGHSGMIPERRGPSHAGFRTRARRPGLSGHIGYVHLETLPLYELFAQGVLERIPAAGPATG
jgi:hypothetical protein